MGDTLDLARRDTADILNSGGFETTLTLTPPTLDPIEIEGIATRHTQGFDSDGLPIIADNAHCTFSETELNDLGATTRDARGRCNISGWRVQFTDAIGAADYTLREPEPDRTLGIIKTKLTIR